MFLFLYVTLHILLYYFCSITECFPFVSPPKKKKKEKLQIHIIKISLIKHLKDTRITVLYTVTLMVAKFSRSDMLQNEQLKSKLIILRL